MEITYLDKASITCSVKQVSILGPLLFLIYITNMSHVIDHDTFNIGI